MILEMSVSLTRAKQSKPKIRAQKVGWLLNLSIRVLPLMGSSN